MTDKQWDILGVGSITVDDLLFVDTFPTEDAKKQLIQADRQGGGLVATALVAATRLGASCAFAGIVGYDEESKWVEQDLIGEGVDISPIVRREDAATIHGYIIVAEDKHTRTIVYSKADIVATPNDYPDINTLKRAKLLLIDDTISPNIAQLAETARTLDIPVVADFESDASLCMADSINHMIVSSRYAQRVTDATDPAAAAMALWHDNRDVVVITAGVDGCCYYTGHGAPQHFPAYNVPIVDTTGCGDVFHGVYCVGLCRGWSLEKRIRYATAAAGMSAGASGGRRGIPNWEQLETFVKERIG